MSNFFNPEAFQSLRERDFRLYWCGNTISRLGSEIQLVALAWQVYLLTNQPLSLGIIGLVRAGPVIVFSILGGALADAMDRRRLLLITQTVLMVLSITLALLVISGAVQVWMLYVITFVAAITTSIDGPAHSAVVPSLVPRNLMTNAITVNNLSWSVAGIAGPALGGLIIGGIGVGAAFALDAVSFLAVIGVLLALKTPLLGAEIVSADRGVKGNLRRIRDGFRFLRHHHIILTLMLLDFFAMLFGASLTLLPVFARDILKVGPEGYGLLGAAPAAGAVIGAAVLTLVRRPHWPGRVVMISIGLYALCVVGFGLSTVFWLSWLFLAGTGAADTVSMTMRQSIRQLLTPEEMRGRIGGVNYLFAVSGTQLGEFEAGVAAQIMGASPAVALGGLACVGLVGLVAFFNSAMRNFTEEVEPASATVVMGK